MYQIFPDRFIAQVLQKYNVPQDQLSASAVGVSNRNGGPIIREKSHKL